MPRWVHMHDADGAAFSMAEADQAYRTFQAAAQHRALKVTIDMGEGAERARL